FFVALILTFRTFVYEPFKIPSGSMIPTLLVGDYLFVSKYSYGYHLPFTRLRVAAGEGPARGDVAVFRYPMDPNKAYIKRVVGLPGDRVEYREKRLFINGVASKYDMKGDYTYRNEQGIDVQAQHWLEVLGQVEHEMLNQPYSYAPGTMSLTVPAGHYFVMGDNRDNSNDSRAWGFVPAYQLVGRAVVLFWSWGQGPPRWERIGRRVQ
ncbi:MAG: signal peptidase I, partial [Magnetococcales bacterium]|nr:signal peptidase I [Magnetococcales bacterium]